MALTRASGLPLSFLKKGKEKELIEYLESKILPLTRNHNSLSVQDRKREGT